jgi:hypothetical protein
MYVKLFAPAVAAGLMLAMSGLVMAQTGLANGHTAPNVTLPAWQSVTPAPRHASARHRAATKQVARRVQRETTGSSAPSGGRAVNR